MKTTIFNLAAKLFIGLSILVSNLTYAQDKLPLIATVSALNPTCANANNGEFSVTINGGFPPYTVNGIQLSGNEYTMSALTEGEYQIDITDAFLSSISGLVILVSPSPLQVTAIVTDVTDLGGSNGSINLTVNSQSPVSYEWLVSGAPLNDPTAEDQFNLSAGWYHVTITEENGCQTIKRFNVLEVVTIQNGNFATSDSQSNNTSAINVYPNPSNGVVNIESKDSEMNYTIYNSVGQLIEEGVVNGKVSTNLPRGTYYINGIDNNNNNTTRSNRTIEVK